MSRELLKILCVYVMQEYVRQVLLEKIIHESEQAALREQAASLLAASHPVAARQCTVPAAAGYGAPTQPPASGMKALHQQHLQNQLLQGLVKTGGSQQQELAAMAHPAQVHNSPFAQMQARPDLLPTTPSALRTEKAQHDEQPYQNTAHTVCGDHRPAHIAVGSFGALSWRCVAMTHCAAWV